VRIDINGQEVESAVVVNAERVFQTSDDPLTPNQEKVLRLICDEKHGVSRNEIADTTGVPYHSLQRILSQLIKLEYIEAEGYGKPYKATQAGLDRLDRLDRGIFQGDLIDDENTARSSRSTDQLREEVDRLDRSTSPGTAIDRTINPDQAAESRDQVDQVQPYLIAPGTDNYYKAGL
jgi:hypothetical protein